MNYNFPDTRLLLSQFLVQRYQTEMLLKFAQEEGILRLLESIDTFHINEAIEALQNKLNYQLQDRLRRRMIHTLIYLLQECGYLSLENTRYQWHMIENAAPKLKDEEYKIIEVSFKGVVGFFEECIKYSGDFCVEQRHVSILMRNLRRYGKAFWVMQSSTLPDPFL
ncbi:MAG: hypothetical protein M5U24_07160 [Candidatus Kuenenia sp.]|uniref:hypothetical protein n=1 Tax=Candidatus Kuenenia sp. TaxID=2499824 RepID=UPI0022BDAB24|nr:hypothetical protein [Candidatus Kuenenia sp.]MCZ7622249.1 hypothetical protein [Candidatus Kuenenia sp.]